jgi:hypothetical protein
MSLFVSRPYRVFGQASPAPNSTYVRVLQHIVVALRHHRKAHPTRMWLTGVRGSERVGHERTAAAE